MSKKPWAGRFAENTHSTVEKFTSSIDFDKRLYEKDIEGSIAHCHMLAKESIISEDEASSLIEGLGTIKREIDRGEFEFDDSLEDIHMHIENRLGQHAGKTAQKLHTARSRNDQVALDVRMYLRDEVTSILESVRNLRGCIIALAKANQDVILPGYTHLQRAQPVLLAHHFMAYYEMFTRDYQRFSDGLKRIDVMPLGAAALAGTTFPINRPYVAKQLNFSKVSTNSIDAVSDRDFVMEFLAASSICMVHFSRLSEELILWSSSEFGFIELHDAFATGSSIMPQKKNPDVAELVRGKTGRVFGNLIALLTIMKALPLAYNRDMQEDKEPLFDTVDVIKACIEIYTVMLPTIKVNADKMYQAASGGFLNATDFADYLVTKGVSFREAHGCAGQAVAYALDNGKELHELTLEELKSFSKAVRKEIFNILTPQQMVNRRTTPGGTALKSVKAAIKAAEKELENEILSDTKTTQKKE